MKYKFDEIVSIEELDNTEEYVYDLEMEDESHTFIANDILVHNTDSIFVGFEPAINSCDWKDLLFNKKALNNIPKPYIIITDDKLSIDINNENYKGLFSSIDIINKGDIPNGINVILVDGYHVKNNELNDIIENSGCRIMYNWSKELDFIHGMDKFKIEGYFLEKLEEHANSYGVENKEDFELERISESIINIAKKKYIQHILFEDGMSYNRLEYIFPKGVELVRSSTPAFAREKIVDIIKYLFANPDTFTIKELLKLVKDLRNEFELADVDDIAMQSSCSNYETKILNDKKLPLEFTSGAHFAVKASAYHNYLLNTNKSLLEKYEFIKSGTKIKYYYCKDTSINSIFAYIRGSYPIEMAPEIDYDEQFMKSILSPINSIISPLGLPEITKRLSVVMDIFSSFN
jgi:hypothetical protein